VCPADGGGFLARVAKTRADTPDELRAAVRDNQDGPDLGFLGAALVNVLEPNLELDQKHPMNR
jgi:potassium-transporting ATPase KdpC subunit